MRAFNLGAVGVVAGALLFGSVGSVSAQELFEADPIDLQFEREVRSTYIVRLSGNLPAQAVNTRANDVANRFGGRILHVYTNTINGFAIRMPSVAMAKMTRAGGLGILSVTRDQIVTIDKGKPAKPGNGGGDTTATSCDQRVPWGVTRVTGIEGDTVVNTGETTSCVVFDPGYFGAKAEPDYASDTKAGPLAPSVCVIDTGVDQDNLDLNLGASSNFTNDKSSDDLHGHGTHVAGIIGAKATDENGVVGVAPNAEIISIKVLNRRGSGSYSGVIAGVDSIAKGANKPCAIANMSLGGSVYRPLVDAVLCAAAPFGTADDELDALGCNTTAEPSGIIFTLAAGNENDYASNHSPANASTGPGDNIFTIAAMGEGNTWASFSNYGKPTVDYIQPGVAIESTFKGGDYKTWSGTSMAAPHMAGLLLRNIVNGTTIVTDGFVTRVTSDDYPIAVNSNYVVPTE